MNLQIPGDTEELAVRLLAETGLKAFRIEIGWGEMSWDESRLNNESCVRRRLELCAQYAIRPTLLINAHQLQAFDRYDAWRQEEPRSEQTSPR